MSMVASSKKEALNICWRGMQETESLFCCVEICFSQIEIGIGHWGRLESIQIRWHVL